MRTLEHAGLLTIDPASAPPVVRISRVVAAHVQAAMPGQMRDRAAHAAADALLEAWPEQEPQPWLAAGLRSCAASLQHAAAGRLWAAEGCHPLLHKAGRSFFSVYRTQASAGGRLHWGRPNAPIVTGMGIYEIEGVVPVVDPTAFVHPEAVLIGDVLVGAGCYVGPLASLRGDFGRVVVSPGANVQDGCVLHCFPGRDVLVEVDGHIGHGAILHGCTIGRGVLVGMNSVVMDGATIGEYSFVGAQSFVRHVIALSGIIQYGQNGRAADS